MQGAGREQRTGETQRLSLSPAVWPSCKLTIAAIRVHVESCDQSADSKIGPPVALLSSFLKVFL